MRLPTLDELSDIVREAVAESGAYTAFRNLESVHTKADGTPVTAIDHSIQNALFARLRAFDAELIGEEGSERRTDSLYAFAIDPLDGTDAFRRGIPTSATVVTLLQRQKNNRWLPVEAVIHEIRPDGWTWSAERFGQTSVRFSDGKTGFGKVKTSTKPLLVTISTWTNVPFNLEAVATDISRDRRFSNQTFGSIALGAGLIASGGIDSTVFAGKSAIETMAMSLIVRGVGGHATNLFGKQLSDYELVVNNGVSDFVLPHGAIMSANSESLKALIEVIVRHN